MKEEIQINVFPLKQENLEVTEEYRQPFEQKGKTVITISSKWWVRYDYTKLFDEKEEKPKLSRPDIRKMSLNWNTRMGDHRVLLHNKKTLGDYREKKEKILKYSVIPAVIFTVIVVAFIIRMFAKF